MRWMRSRPPAAADSAPAGDAANRKPSKRQVCANEVRQTPSRTAPGRREVRVHTRKPHGIMRMGDLMFLKIKFIIKLSLE